MLRATSTAAIISTTAAVVSTTAAIVSITSAISTVATSCAFCFSTATTNIAISTGPCCSSRAASISAAICTATAAGQPAACQPTTGQPASGTLRQLVRKSCLCLGNQVWDLLGLLGLPRVLRVAFAVTGLAVPACRTTMHSTVDLIACTPINIPDNMCPDSGPGDNLALQMYVSMEQQEWSCKCSDALHMTVSNIIPSRGCIRSP